MSAIAPVCQLLERHDPARYRGWWRVAPPLETNLVRAGREAFWSSNEAVGAAFAERDQQVHIGIDAPAEKGEGALLFWPKSHALGIWWLETLCRWLAPGTPIEIVGEHQGGVKRVPKVLEAHAMPCERIDNARRCSLFSSRTVALPEGNDGWSEFEALGLRLASHPGVFGHGKLDAGTGMLLERLGEEYAKRAPATALDVGCGDGVISAWLARAGSRVSALDVDHFAVEATRRSLALNGLQGEVTAHDMLLGVEGRFDAIVSNPPFHQARDIDYGPARRLIEMAPSHLNPGGRLYIVANVFLPYRAPLEASFERVDTLVEDGRFRVYRADRPRPKRR
ncbi:class I SAM-dependent methyltransferase [Halotalea alkalilenta]|uniref:class I SAM-dependent methyltransferase n=1 Tax=Halotalea alkalilenta TaxID=376489 RepID=UPI00048730EC|nr:class I SAM-dependent methyltransferase [Halotalea alkalilenta]